MEKKHNSEPLFLDAVQNERDAFCHFIMEKFPLMDKKKFAAISAEEVRNLRTACESLLIIFDQLHERELRRTNADTTERDELYKNLLVAALPGKKLMDKIDRQTFILSISNLADLAMTEIKKGAI